MARVAGRGGGRPWLEPGALPPRDAARGRAARGLPARPAAHHRLRQHHRRRGRAAYPGDEAHRRAHPAHRSLERGGHGARARTRLRRHRRPHLDLRLERELYEVGFNHFFRGKDERGGAGRPDLLPGARLARHLRARVSRRAASGRAARALPARGGARRGLSLVPAPAADARTSGSSRPSAWASGRITSIYQARFNRYLHARGSCDTSHVARLVLRRRRRDRRARDARRAQRRGARGARQPDLRRELQPPAPRRPGARQRQDHPGARGGLPRRGLERDQGGLGSASGTSSSPATARRAAPAPERGRRRPVAEATRTATGDYVRKDFFSPDPRMLELVSHMSDDEIAKLRRGGHDYRKVHAAYRAAVNTTRPPDRDPRPHGEGLDARRGLRGQERHAPEEEDGRSSELKAFRDLLELPIPDEQLEDDAVLPPRSEQRRGRVPARAPPRARRLGAQAPRGPRRASSSSRTPTVFDEFYEGMEKGEASTTMVFSRLLAKLLRDKKIGSRIVPIIPDEARTFGMDALFSQVGIYARRPALRADRQGQAPLLPRSARTARCSKRASPRPARWRRSPRRAPRTRRTASR